MATWGLADAKAHLSEVIEKAMHDGPQEITRSGRDAVVVVSKKAWLERERPAETLVEFFRKSPAYGADFEVKRIALKPRKVSF